jgi:hypothetical protein
MTGADAAEARPDPADHSSHGWSCLGGAGINDEGGTTMRRMTRMLRIDLER